MRTGNRLSGRWFGGRVGGSLRIHFPRKRVRISMSTSPIELTTTQARAAGQYLIRYADQIERDAIVRRRQR